MTSLRIVRLLPDLLAVNGCLGNAEILRVRAEWSGWKVTVTDAVEGGKFPASADVLVIGHGTSSAALRAAQALHGWSSRIASLYEKGATLVGFGLGGDLLGQSVDIAGERREGLGLTPIHAVLPHRHVSTEVWGVDSEGRESAGYLNDLIGREPSPTPLLTVRAPSSAIGAEGHRGERLFVSAVSGPLLGLNPHIADDILRSQHVVPDPTQWHVAADTAAANARRAIAKRLGV